MNLVLRAIIRLYWWSVAESRRRECIFAESCSKFVMRHARSGQAFAGPRALWRRICTCRAGYRIFYCASERRHLVGLADGSVVELTDMADAVRAQAPSLIEVA